MEASIWLWIGFNAFVVLLLAIDLGLLHRKQREIGVREALFLSLFYFLLAMVFNAGIFDYPGYTDVIDYTLTATTSGNSVLSTLYHVEDLVVTGGNWTITDAFAPATYNQSGGTFTAESTGNSYGYRRTSDQIGPPD